MRKALAVSFAFSLFALPLLCFAAPRRAVGASSSAFPYPQDQQDQSYPGDQGYPEYVPYSPEQLDNLLAPIALYPDPLLAQLLPAATFVDEVDAAARYVRAYGEDGVDDQPWDVSVRAVAHYPEVLYMMDEKLDWTTAVGQAYVNQSTDVMESIQRLRSLAYGQGNLVSNAEWEIVNNNGYIQIWPASPEYVYVPTYNPGLIYYHRCYYGGTFFFGFAFGRAFHIGIWLNRDTDWQHHRIYYTGWRGQEGWERRSRPYIERNDVRIRNRYINNRLTNVFVDRTITHRPVHVTNINSYNSIHREVHFNNMARNRGVADTRPQINNRVVNRNFNTGDPGLNQFRGRQQPPTPGRPQEQFFRPEAPQPRPQQPQAPVRPQERPPQQFRPSPAIENGPHAFGRSETTFNPRMAQQRGAQSRQEMRRPVQRPPAPPRQSRPSRPAQSKPHGRGRGRGGAR